MLPSIKSAIRQDFETDDHGTLLEDGRVHFVRNKGVPGTLGFAVPAKKPGTEIDPLGIAENLNATGTCAGMQRHLRRDLQRCRSRLVRCARRA